MLEFRMMRGEVDKPKAQRRWGYVTLPDLQSDRPVGKVDATADRRSGVLRVDAVYEDVPLPRNVRCAVRGELADLAAWPELDRAGPAVAR